MEFLVHLWEKQSLVQGWAGELVWTGQSPEQRKEANAEAVRTPLTYAICSWGIAPSVWFEVFLSHPTKCLAEMEAYVLYSFVKMQLRLIVSLPGEEGVRLQEWGGAWGGRGAERWLNFLEETQSGACPALLALRGITRTGFVLSLYCLPHHGHLVPGYFSDVLSRRPTPGSPSACYGNTVCAGVPLPPELCTGY